MLQQTEDKVVSNDQFNQNRDAESYSSNSNRNSSVLMDQNSGLQNLAVKVNVKNKQDKPSRSSRIATNEQNDESLTPEAAVTNELNVSNNLKCKKTLAEQLDEIDEQFNGSQQEAMNTDVVAPDGIQMAVEPEQEREFDKEELVSDEDETIYPVKGNDDDDYTIVGEENLNSSMSSSAIISFKSSEKVVK